MKWQDFAPKRSSRVRESTEWSIHYAYDSCADGQRVLLIGDSICNNYQDPVHRLLTGRMNVSFWASSKCVTDPDYLRELEYILDCRPCDMICFNNGLHSINTDRTEWVEAYNCVLNFLQAKYPQAKLALTLCTPAVDPAYTALSEELNALTEKIAAERGIPTIDLFTPMNALDREEHWRDAVHFRPAAIEMQGEIVAKHVAQAMGLPEA